MKKCPICGELMDKTLVICEECEHGYDANHTTIEKRKKEHVIDGGTWWRVDRRDKKGA